jgi:hypothetical protein
MWQFFTDHRQSFVEECNNFWLKVESDTETTYAHIRKGTHVHFRQGTHAPKPDESSGGSQPPTEQANSERPKRVAKWAYRYLDGAYKLELHVAHRKLLEALIRSCLKFPLEPEPLTLIVCFDEARNICTSSSVDRSDHE